jgi:CTP:molybdopterin cytidylyltransferase MocA
VIVVTGAIGDLLSAEPSNEGRGDVVVCHNDRWAEGQSTSVHAGIEAAKGLGCNRVIIGLADQPFIPPEAWRLVAAGPGPITVATYGGQRRNPVGLDTAIWHLMPTEGDEGARTLIRVRPDLVCEVSCPGSPADIDTEEDLRRWQNN